VRLGLALRGAWPRGIDVSDGLVGISATCCNGPAVGAGVNVPDVPRSDTLRAVEFRIATALCSGRRDDYELLFNGFPGRR